jgi:U6 snRNA-associated Sm-like protein LSm1
MLVILRDGKKLHGVLRSYDQFGEAPSHLITQRSAYFPNFCGMKIIEANLVLEDTYERIYHDNEFAERWLGVFVVRGENVVLLGEIVRPYLGYFACHLSRPPLSLFLGTR